jgi:hypothetical protein
VVFIELQYPKFTDFSDKGRESLSNLGNYSGLIIEFGFYVLKFDHRQEEEYKGYVNSILIIPFMRAHVSANLLLDKAERKSLYARLTGKELGELGGNLEK